MLQTSRILKSIKLGSLDGVELPQFVVMTGPNGSGKSNLLEALQTNAVIFTEFGYLQAPAVRLFVPGQLVATAEGALNPASLSEPWSDLFNNVQSWKAQAVSLGSDESAQDAWVRGNVVTSKQISETDLARMVERARVPLIRMTADDFRRYASLSRGVRSLFEQTIGEQFLLYSQRDWNNSVLRHRYSEQGGENGLNSEEFLEHFGRPPWVLLNEILQRVGLSTYQFEAPPLGTSNINYEVFLHDDDGNQVRPAELSSGEKVLLALATSMQSGTSVAQSFEFPRLLLLDEPDASLHPSMSRSLLTVLQEIFVDQYGVRVIMTTHSPTTVALAPEESLYVMRRSSQPRLSKVTTDEALNILTVGISSLSVRLENRRQVFVESEYDQAVYQELAKVVKPMIASDRSLEFIAVGKRETGGGCDAVKRLVGNLRESGLTTVHGIVDRDKRHGAAPYIHFVPDRYSVENLVLDPLLIGTFLLREGILRPDRFGLPPTFRSFQLTSSEAPAIVAAVADAMGFTGDTKSVNYSGGFALEISVNFLDTQGHALEDQYLDAFQALNAYGKNLKLKVVTLAAADAIGFTPQVAVELFSSILQSA